tara:strand:- start:1472 stop:2050 length:579 start_codon:yes stop_codon:yes gene_type:complete
MAFNLKSGNKPKFKMMGCSSPMKKHTKAHGAPKKTSEDYINEGFSPREALQMEKDGAVTGHDYKGKKDDKKKEMKPPKKSTTSAHGQLSDAQAEYETDKKLYDKYMKDKAKKDSMKKKKAEKKGEDRPDPTYEGTDEFRKEEDIPKEEFEKRGLKKPKKKKSSPNKNYKNPQDYKVFNMGNKPTPVKKHKKY